MTILIPPADEPQGVGAVAPVEIGRIDAIAASAAGAESSTDVGSRSILIAVEETAIENPPIAAIAVSAQPPIVAAFPPGLTNGPPTVAPELPAALQPFVVPKAIEPVSPAVRYVARRERNRRNQFTIAMLLLLAVIVLAGVLIWVLQSGSRVPPAEKSPPISLFELPPSRYVAVTSDRCPIECHMQVAT